MKESCCVLLAMLFDVSPVWLLRASNDRQQLHSAIAATSVQIPLVPF